MNKQESTDAICEAQIHLAERELSAFVHAVTKLFGPEQAGRAAEDWLAESELPGGPPRFTPGDWRAVTVAASAKLASEMNLAQRRRLPASDAN